MSTKKIIVNGREWSWPSDSATTEEIRKEGSLVPTRNVFLVRDGRQTLMKPGTRVSIKEGDVFSDAPVPVKG